MAFQFTLQNWGDRPSWHHSYHVSSSSSPSIRTWGQLKRETLAGESSHRKVKPMNTVRSCAIDQFNSWWNNFGHTEETRKWRNSNCKLAKEIHISHLGYIDIDWTDTQNAPNWQRRTLIVLNFTKTPGIAISCWDLFQFIFHGTLYQT